MRHVYRQICLVSMLFTVLTVQAVQLGSSKGSVVFGRPLDLTMQVRLDTPFDESANCFSADVFQADNKFDAGRVRLDVTPTANSLDATIRVRSISPVNEPWAKIVLRSNCGSKISRQYDFLTDFAADTQTSSTLAEIATPQPATTTNASTSPSKLTTNQQLASSSSNTLSASSAKTATAQAPVSNWSVKRSQAKVKTQPSKPNTDPSFALKKVSPTTQTVVAPKKTTDLVTDAVGQSRLKMETFELTDEHQVLLKLSSALTAPTGMRTPEEIQALAQATAVWRAINGMPAEVKAATVVAAPAISPAAPTPTLVNQKLADKSEFPNLVVYGLIGLLAITMGCIAWLWIRVNKASRAGYGWLNDSVTEDAVVSSEPFHSQFLPAKERVGGSDAHDSYEPMFEEEEVVVEKAEPAKQVAEKSSEVVVEKEKKVAVPSNDNQIVSALPLHFDEPRLNERVLRAHKKPRDSSHDKPITAPTELIDFALLDTPPKLHAVTAPAVPTPGESISKPNYTTVTSKPVVAKDNTKGNLIDFDVFAEPTAEVPDKSSGIGR